MIRRSSLALTCITLCALVTACGDTKFYLKGGPNLNPNDGKTPTPVNVKVFQLRDNSAFDGAGFNAAWGAKSGGLGGAVLEDPVPRSVVPKEKTVLTLTKDKNLNAQTQYIGIVVNFTPPGAFPPAPVTAKWKMSVSLDDIDGATFFMNNIELKLEK